MKIVLIIAGILAGIVLLGFIALQLFFTLPKSGKDKDVI